MLLDRLDLYCYCGYHVSCKLAICAVSQLVCLLLRSSEESFLRQALKVKRSSSHSQRKFLFFLVRGRRYMYSLGLR